MANVNEGAAEVVSNRVLTAPNAISFARLLLCPVFLWLYLIGHVLPAMILLIVVGVSDFVDGFVARATGQVSVLGKLLDPLSDRFVIIAVLVAFGAKGTVPWWLVAVIVARDVIIMVAFAVFEKRGLPRLAVNRTGKRATAALFGGMGIVSISVVMKVSGVAGMKADAAGVRTAGLVLLGAGAVLYWAAGFLYAREIRRLLRAKAAGASTGG
ncbi:MAG TPA: CDP-alcohol phosphatidyltransferase family protein [Actinomycetota bacterium]|nr:CDP-alcohol phosphatidyltransferase family protein [Actinomycetota bacterium]